MCTRVTSRVLLLVVLTVVVESVGQSLGDDNVVLGRRAAARRAQQPQTPEKPIKAVADVPHELAMRTLPTYRIEPPDLLSIEVLKLVPKPPFRIGIFDVLQIRVAGALPSQPIDGYFIVEAEGIVTLGPSYGTVRVVGMTIEEATQTITKQLQAVLKNADVSVQLAKAAGIAPVSGEYVVGPDGTINLRQYGTLQVTGMTIAEATAALKKRLTKYFDSPEPAVDVKQFNSKVFYVITEGVGAGAGDSVRRVPITGNDFVLDALSVIGGLSQISSKKIWVARPSASNPEKGLVLPVDYEAITRRGATATNYQLFPGDRVFIAQDPLTARNNELAKETASIERVLGLIGLATSVLQNFMPPASH
jgi:polysaccharide biosynthesis/export protein